ncbi:MAG: histidine kinase [Spirochaetaceae bacterium]|nr:histidine kinase [Spirochaetaceae bacterium]
MQIINAICSKIKKYYLYILVLPAVSILIYLLSLNILKEVEELMLYKSKIDNIYSKWIEMKSDALNYLKSDKQENIKAKLNKSIDIFKRDFSFLSDSKLNHFNKASPEVINNIMPVIILWDEIQLNMIEIAETPADFKYFTDQIYWLTNDTVIFEYSLKELIRWFDVYNKGQLLFHWRLFFLFTVIILGSALFVRIILKKYLKEKKAREKTLKIMNSIVSERETERLRLALDIHDTIAQNLSFSKMLCYDLNAQAPIGETMKTIDNLTEIITKTTSQIRSIIYDLMPPELENNSIENVFYDYCNSFQEKTYININLEIKEFQNISINKSQQITLYRILQECLSNVYKHSSAKNVNVLFSIDSPHIFLKISDDGRGLKPPVFETESSYQHIGLRGIQERIDIFDGEMEITNKPKIGYTICIKMVLKDTNDER